MRTTAGRLLFDSLWVQSWMVASAVDVHRRLRVPLFFGGMSTCLDVRPGKAAVYLD